MAVADAAEAAETLEGLEQMIVRKADEAAPADSELYVAAIALRAVREWAEGLYDRTD